MTYAQGFSARDMSARPVRGQPPGAGSSRQLQDDGWRFSMNTESRGDDRGKINNHHRGDEHDGWQRESQESVDTDVRGDRNRGDCNREGENDVQHAQPPKSPPDGPLLCFGKRNIRSL